ncbi:MAG: metalloregulator ArsR/SmtB family transcription factor [Kangiellaceae bacterium]|nr:metalloregulator ArsR/SmtB family transcription factor [Kangiellaceae bacterium]MCW9017600.1 metalloregulator ArsR/SmtB family transcription factor [Kangiellaceae bacterium]
MPALEPIQFYKSLADETRLTTALIIQHEEELCVCELTKALNEIQPKVSRHLAQLKKSGILNDRKQGQWVFYSINSQLPDWAKQVLKITLEQNSKLIQKPLANLDKMGNRPERVAICC